ncbi:MAG TPA: hypothetical protein VGQ72_10095 [Pyrinomonadaceae bacterium]|nr:hypothetical protein [Pyrinomonadaceae bacterium]
MSTHKFQLSETFRRKTVVAPTLIALTLIGLASLVFVSARSKSGRVKSRDAASSQIPNRRLYVRAGGLWPQLRWNLKALGDRLERPGKEQIIITGTLTRAGVTAPVVLNIEAPNRMTLTQQTGLQTQVINFDGTESSWIALAAADRDLVETLFFDTAENFFFGQMKGTATRCLGFRFRPDTQNTAGPFHDLYAVGPVPDLPSSSQTPKLFHFNSDTRLLDLITYQTAVRVEVKLSDWQETNGQRVARRIERLENGATRMLLTIENVAFAPGPPTVPR